MEMLFSQEQVWELDRREIADEARQEGIDLMGELMRRLEPLGRIGELIAATSDMTKLSVLAQEFGLEV